MKNEDIIVFNKLQEKLEILINATPSGESRNHLTELNTRVLNILQSLTPELEFEVTAEEVLKEHLFKYYKSKIPTLTGTDEEIKADSIVALNSLGLKNTILEAMNDYVIQSKAEATNQISLNDNLLLRFKDNSDNKIEILLSVKEIWDNIQEFVYEKLENSIPHNCTNESTVFCECPPVYETFKLDDISLQSNAEAIREHAIDEETLLSLIPSYDKGVNGCTYGDTEYSSIDVVYGYNLAIDYFRENINKYLTTLTK